MVRLKLWSLLLLLFTVLAEAAPAPAPSREIGRVPVLPSIEEDPPIGGEMGSDLSKMSVVQLRHARAVVANKLLRLAYEKMTAKGLKKSPEPSSALEEYATAVDRYARAEADSAPTPVRRNENLRRRADELRELEKNLSELLKGAREFSSREYYLIRYLRTGLEIELRNK